jgi:hypothetical protein
MLEQDVSSETPVLHRVKRYDKVKPWLCELLPWGLLLYLAAM